MSNSRWASQASQAAHMSNSRWASQAANMFPRPQSVAQHPISINMELGRELVAMKNDKRALGVVTQTMCHKDMVTYLQANLHRGLFDELVEILDEVPPGVPQVPQRFKQFHAYTKHFQRVADDTRSDGSQGHDRVWIGGVGGWRQWLYVSLGLVIVASCVVGLMAGVASFAVGGILVLFGTGVACAAFLLAYSVITISGDAHRNFRTANMYASRPMSLRHPVQPPPSRLPAIQTNLDGTTRHAWEYDPALMPGAQEGFDLTIQGGAKAHKQALWLPTKRTVMLMARKHKVWRNKATGEERVKTMKTVNGVRKARYVKF